MKLIASIRGENNLLIGLLVKKEGKFWKVYGKPIKKDWYLEDYEHTNIEAQTLPELLIVIADSYNIGEWNLKFII
jgi:hypothetical protein